MRAQFSRRQEGFSSSVTWASMSTLVYEISPTKLSIGNRYTADCTSSPLPDVNLKNFSKKLLTPINMSAKFPAGAENLA
jgi:hypothetical protein